MAEYAGKRELNIIGNNEVTKRDPQLQQIMDLTIEKLKGTCDGTVSNVQNGTHQLFPHPDLHPHGYSFAESSRKLLG
jgi:hypothetical protein